MPAVGILGGSFNPPHNGHLALARAALRELGLGRVVLMPLHTPAHKQPDGDPGAEHRLAMCRLAVEGEPGLEASPLEVQRGGPSYTVDTLKEIHASEPGAELTFIVGADTALTIPGWSSPEDVLSLARLAVASRPGSDGAQVLDALAGVMPADGSPGVVFLSMEPVEASSTEARERVAAGGDVSGLLPAAVADYIAEHDLYRRSGS